MEGNSISGNALGGKLKVPFLILLKLEEAEKNK